MAIDDLLTSLTDYIDNNDIEGRQLQAVTTDYATRLARDVDLRVDLGRSTELWSRIDALWRVLLDQATSSPSESASLADVIVAMARFVRNMVAGVPANQEAAFSSESKIRGLIRNFTAYYRGLEENSRLAARMLVQMVSNTVTGNDALQTSLWNELCSSDSQDDTLLRILGFTDVQTRFAGLILTLNCIKGSYRRSHQFTASNVLVTILDMSATDSDAESDESATNNETFEIVYSIFRELFDQSFQPTVWKRLQVEGEPITPQEISFLKLVDAYIQQQPSSTQPNKDGSFSFLVTKATALVKYGMASIQRVLPLTSNTPATSSSSPDNPNTTVPDLIHAPDLQLPPVLEGLVLVAQCSISIVLQEIDDPAPTQASSKESLSNLFKAQPNLLEELFELLRLLDRLLPRILWGKSQPGAHQILPDTNSSSLDTTDPQAFAYVKRDLVRLVGVLSHEDSDVQDRVRKCGGIHVVLNLCVVDERNPYLREHALFALRNILKGNEENQAIVAELKPMGKWDSEGVLRDTPGSTRR